jgi:hypothetical protein
MLQTRKRHWCSVGCSGGTQHATPGFQPGHHRVSHRHCRAGRRVPTGSPPGTERGSNIDRAPMFPLKLRWCFGLTFASAGYEKPESWVSVVRRFRSELGDCSKSYMAHLSLSGRATAPEGRSQDAIEHATVIYTPMMRERAPCAASEAIRMFQARSPDADRIAWAPLR